MNSLNGLSNFSIISNLSGVSSGNFDNITTDDITSNKTYQGQTQKEKILFLTNVSSDIQQQINNINSSGYVTTSSLSDTLLFYISSNQLNDILSSYVTSTQLSITNQDVEFLQTDVSSLQTILTGCSYDNIYNFLNLSNNLHVYGSLFIGNNIDVNSIISNLPTTYATISSLSNYALNSSLSNYALNSSLSNYVLTTSLNTKLNDYVLTTALNTKLNDYVLSTVLNSYVTNTSLNNTLGNYVSFTGLTNTLNSYVLTSTLSNYALISSLNGYCTTANYNTLKTKVDNLQTEADDSKNWIAVNSGVVSGLVTSVGLLVAADLAQDATNLTFSSVVHNDEQDGYITNLQAKTTQISYSVATTTTSIGGAQLTTNAISATGLSCSSITNSGTLSNTGDITGSSTITASGNISSTSGTIITGTLNTNNINTKSGSTINIANAATTINMGSSTLGNTINVGNLLSTINLNGNVTFTSNNPFNMFNSYFSQF